MKRPLWPNWKETDVRFLEWTELKICETRVLKFLRQDEESYEDEVPSAKERTVDEFRKYIQKRRDALWEEEEEELD